VLDALSGLERVRWRVGLQVADVRACVVGWCLIPGTWNADIHAKLQIAVERCGCSGAALLRASAAVAIALPLALATLLLR
jgi:hypothetical protein